MTTTATTTADLPAPGAWELDPGHADVSFTGRHFGLTKVRGRFDRISGLLEMAEDPAASRVAVTIDMGSVSSGDASRDDHLRSEDLFDVAAHPTATFRSTAVEVRGTTGTMTGDLTIKGISRPVALDVAYLGQADDPWGGRRAVFTARTEIDREDWGLTWNMVLEAGGLLVSKRITIEIDAEFIRQP